MSGKRRRQENFQSRKRQAPSAAPGADTSTETAITEDMDTQPAASVAMDSRLNPEMQSSVLLAVTGVAPETGSLGTTASLHDQTTDTANLNGQLQLQGVPPAGLAAHTMSPANSNHAASPPIAQPDEQANRASTNGQVNAPSVEKPATDRSGMKSGPQRCVVAKPVNEARGHTGYLTFARRSVEN